MPVPWVVELDTYSVLGMFQGTNASGPALRALRLPCGPFSDDLAEDAINCQSPCNNVSSASDTAFRKFHQVKTGEIFLYDHETGQTFLTVTSTITITGLGIGYLYRNHVPWALVLRRVLLSFILLWTANNPLCPQ
jgi:hypothetical protein